MFDDKWQFGIDPDTKHLDTPIHSKTEMSYAISIIQEYSREYFQPNGYRQKNENVQPGPEIQYSYIHKKSVAEKKINGHFWKSCWP